MSEVNEEEPAGKRERAEERTIRDTATSIFNRR